MTGTDMWVNKPVTVPVIFETPCIYTYIILRIIHQVSHSSIHLRKRQSICLQISYLILKLIFVTLTHLCKCLKYIFIYGNRGGAVVKVLCYKSEGRCFDPRRCHWNFSLP